jgi:carboxyl-terminal processing protease
MCRLMLLLITLVFAGCGGGGGGAGGGPLAGACTVADEKNSILSTMQDWYFFNSPDFPGQTAKYNGINLANYATANDLLDFLRYQPTQFDRGFSFITTVAADQQFLGQGEFVGFGFGSKFVDAPLNEDLRFTRVFAGSPADQAGFQRGFRILELDGRTIAEINQAEGVNAALGPADEGFTVEFLIRDSNGMEFTVQVSKALVTIDPVPPVPNRIIDFNGRPVGYINFRTFISTADPALDGVFAQFQAQNVRDLIIDVRYNGGGLVSVAERLGDLIGGAALPAGSIFSRTLFNPDRASNNDERRFAQLANSIAMLDSVVFIITGSSASASELMINSFLPHTTVVIVGSLSGGKPVGQSAFDFCANTQRFRLVTFEIVNALNQGRYFGGIPADCPAEDDLDFPLGDANEASLAAALTRIDTGQCPPLPAVLKPQFNQGVAEVPLGPNPGSARFYAGAF